MRINRKTRERKCLFYSTNAKTAERNLTNWYGSIPIKSFVPIAVGKRKEIIRAKCIPRRENKVKNVRGIAKLVAVATKICHKKRKTAKIG